MDIDWKDKLNQLRGSFNEPDEIEQNEIEEPEEKPKGQKTALTVVTDKKGRNGKIATIIEGFTIDQSEVEQLARELKNRMGTGGSVREGEILIQGDCKTKVIEFLKSRNFKVR